MCDRNCFCTGSTPTQNVDKLVPFTLKKFGKKVYVVAADYNYGQITSKWVKNSPRSNGGEVLNIDYFPLEVSDFGPAITKIQAAKPNFVMSVLVGGNHISFYRQWAAAGMNKTVPVASTTFGNGLEQQVTTPEEHKGYIAAQSYFQEVDTPANQAFLKKFLPKYGASSKYVTSLAIQTYHGMHLWALGVKKANSIDRMKVIEALESNISYTGPAGKTAIDPQTHHCSLDVYIAEARTGSSRWSRAIRSSRRGHRRGVRSQEEAERQPAVRDRRQGVGREGGLVASAKLPTPDELKAVGRQLGMTLSDADVAFFLETMGGSVAAYHALEAMVDPMPVVKYPRTPGYRPEGAENKYNAWYYKSEVKGAPNGKLKGKRVALKDNVCLAGVPMMNGASTLEGYVPDVDATIVTRILDAGGTIMGKVHCEYFCFSGGSHTSSAGPCKTRARWATPRAGRRRGAGPWWRPARSRWPSAAIRAAPSACRRRTAASTA